MPPADAFEATWNVVVTLPEDTFREACRLLGRRGRRRHTHFYNVLAMRVADPQASAAARTPVHIAFNDMDKVIQIETIQWSGGCIAVEPRGAAALPFPRDRFDRADRLARLPSTRTVAVAASRPRHSSGLGTRARVDIGGGPK